MVLRQMKKTKRPPRRLIIEATVTVSNCQPGVNTDLRGMQYSKMNFIGKFSTGGYYHKIGVVRNVKKLAAVIEQNKQFVGSLRDS